MRDARRSLFNPLDAVRRGLTRGLGVAAVDPQVRRRGRLRAKVTIEDPQRLGDLVTGQRLPFELTLPADAYPSCESPNGSLSWEFDVWSDERGVDTHERRMLVLLAPP